VARYLRNFLHTRARVTETRDPSPNHPEIHRVGIWERGARLFTERCDEGHEDEPGADPDDEPGEEVVQEDSKTHPD
jgi:hypothetical protein